MRRRDGSGLLALVALLLGLLGIVLVAQGIAHRPLQRERARRERSAALRVVLRRLAAGRGPRRYARVERGGEAVSALVLARRGGLRDVEISPEGESEDALEEFLFHTSRSAPLPVHLRPLLEVLEEVPIEGGEALRRRVEALLQRAPES